MAKWSTKQSITLTIAIAAILFTGFSLYNGWPTKFGIFSTEGKLNKVADTAANTVVNGDQFLHVGGDVLKDSASKTENHYYSPESKRK